MTVNKNVPRSLFSLLSLQKLKIKKLIFFESISISKNKSIFTGKNYVLMPQKHFLKLLTLIKIKVGPQIFSNLN